MAPDVTDIRIVTQERSQYRLGSTAVRALEIGVLNDGDGTLLGPRM